jgi:CysZ protein
MNRLKIKKYNEQVTKNLLLFFDAHNFVLKNKLYRHLIITGLIFIAVFSVGLTFLIQLINWTEKIYNYDIQHFLTTYINLDSNYIRYITHGSFWILKHALKANKDSIFLSLFLILGTPYLSFLSGKIQKIVSNKASTFTWKKFLFEIYRGLSISIRNILKQFLWFILILAISYIPYLEYITPFFGFIIQAYYNGILISDYTLEQKGFSIKESFEFYKMNKFAMFSTGLGFMFILLIPVVGWFIAPTYALVSTSLYFEKNKLKEEDNQQLELFT